MIVNGYSMKNDRLVAALSYVRRGWEVFPAPPGTKAGYSVKSRGHDNGAPWGKTTDEAEIRKYWRRLPQANIGIPMGIGSGIFDIECDTKAGHPELVKDGAASLAELEAKFGTLPATLMFESPTGSMHRLFTHPGDGVEIRSRALDAVNYPGIDVKGDGGMSIAPPSKTSKGVYRWLNRRRVAAAPDWLLAMVRKPEYATRERSVWEVFADSTTQQVSIEELAWAMAMIPNDIDVSRKQWVDVGLALWNATGGSEEGYQLFAAWSQRWPGYNEEKTRTFWDTVNRKDLITAGTILFLAEQAQPDWKARILSGDPDVIALLEEFHTLLGEPA